MSTGAQTVKCYAKSEFFDYKVFGALGLRDPGAQGPWGTGTLGPRGPGAQGPYVWETWVRQTRVLRVPEVGAAYIRWFIKGRSYILYRGSHGVL